MKLRLLYACVLYLLSSVFWEIGHAATVCPPMPDKITQVNRDVRLDIQGSVGSLGKIKAGEVASKTEVVAKSLFEKYPNIDRLVTVQMMAAAYCSMINESTSMSEREKHERWEKFQERVFSFVDPNYRSREPSGKAPGKSLAPSNQGASKPPLKAAKADAPEATSKRAYLQGPSQPKPIVPPDSTAPKA